MKPKVLKDLGFTKVEQKHICGYADSHICEDYKDGSTVIAPKPTYTSKTGQAK